MVAFAHTSVGIIIGTLAYQNLGAGNPVTGLLITGFAGLISHYLFDFIPHGHFFRGDVSYRKFIIWVMLFDLLLPFLFFAGASYYLGKSPLEILYLLFGVGGSQLPDVLAGLRNFKMIPRPAVLTAEFNFHMSTHWHGQGKKALLFTLRDFWQVSLFVIALYLLIK